MSTVELIKQFGVRLTTHICARCGRTLRDGHWVYSSYTDRHFCVDDKQCKRRAIRRSR